MSNPTSGPFVHDEAQEWEDLGAGIKRKLLTYEDKVMMAKIAFKKGAVGEPHSHPHIQCSYVESGEFELTIGAEVRKLKAGDSFLVPTNVRHGAIALTDGVLIDVFAPHREDFLT